MHAKPGDLGAPQTKGLHHVLSERASGASATMSVSSQKVAPVATGEKTETTLASIPQKASPQTHIHHLVCVQPGKYRKNGN